MSNTELFIDGVINVSLVKGLVRIDLYSLSATEQQGDGSAKPEFRQRLILHPSALPDIHRSLQFAVAALRERGLISGPAPDDEVAAVTGRDPNQAETIVGAPGEEAEPIQKMAPPDPAASKPRSPNFPATMSPPATADAQ